MFWCGYFTKTIQVCASLLGFKGAQPPVPGSAFRAEARGTNGCVPGPLGDHSAECSPQRSFLTYRCCCGEIHICLFLPLAHRIKGRFNTPVASFAVP